MITAEKIILNRFAAIQRPTVLFGLKMKNIFQWTTDDIFKKILQGMGLSMLLILAGIVVTLTLEAWPAIKAIGPSFVTEKTWDPVFEEYGALVLFFRDSGNILSGPFDIFAVYVFHSAFSG